MTGEEPRLQALTRIPYFADLDAAVLKDVSRAVIRRRCEADEVVVLEGEPCSGLGIVRTGRLKTVKLSTAGREQILSILEPGDIFSAVSVFADAPNPATVVALKPSTLWIIPRDRLLTLQNRYPELTQGIIRGLADRVLHLVTLIEDLSLRTVEMRLARQLLDHAEGDLIEREPWATQAEMSARLGTVTYVLNRVLRGFEEEGLIDVERHRIRILDAERLSAKADPT
jgi:CRP/FNR family transcriptional regulator